MRNIFKFSKNSTFSMAKHDKKMSEYVPYVAHYNPNTLITKSGELISIVKLNGFAFETADFEEIESLKNSRNNLFKGFGTGQFGLYTHVVRRRRASYPEGSFTDPFCSVLNDNWKEIHEGGATFENNMYISVIRKNSKVEEAMTKMFTMFQKISEEDELENSENKTLMEYNTQLQEVLQRILHTLGSYNPKILSCEKRNGVYTSELLSFLGTIINCGKQQNVAIPATPIDSYLQAGRITVGRNYGEYDCMTEKRFFSIVGLKEYSNATHAGLFDNFLHMPFEFVLSQSFNFIDKMIAVNKIRLQQGRLIQSQDVAVSQIQDINQALDDAMSGTFSFGNHHTTLMVIANSKKQLDTFTSNAVVEFANCGLTSVRESINLEASFWGQLPGNVGMIVRSSIINTLNFAGFSSFHNYPSGKVSGNHWGDAVTVFNTTSGTPYFFNFHVRDVGHTMIVGPTGAGKTVLLTFLCAQSQKFSPRMFFFDKDHGAEIFVRAIGGKYSVIDASENCGFNPLQLPDTASNRTFLTEWLCALVSTNQEIITAEDQKVIEHAVQGNYNLPLNQRKLSNLAAFFGVEVPGNLASRLAQWHSGGAKCKIFDNDTDHINFTSSKVFGFEMGEILGDQIAIAPVLLYLFHRIQEALDGTPTMIVLDEAWALIDNHVFGPRIKNWLKVLRKLNAMVIFATQSIEDATKSSISDTLVQQTATQIFLPNLKATPEYQKIFMLSEREHQIVKTTDPGSRFFLVKQDRSAVVTRLDLSEMEDIVSILSGRVETVEILHRIMAETGEEPLNWIAPFINTVMEEEAKKRNEKR